MTGRRLRALLIGNAKFPRDPHNLHTLKGPPNDLERLREALCHAQVAIPTDRKRLDILRGPLFPTD